MKIIDKVWVFDYLMEILMIMTMVCGQSLLTNSLYSLGYISIHISFIIFNKLFHGNQVQLSFPLPAIDFYVVICLIITIVFYIRRKNGESKTYFKS